MTEDCFRGRAILICGSTTFEVDAVIAGRHDPIDGKYHWYGRLRSADGSVLPRPGRAQMHLKTDIESGAARIEEIDPWGYSRIVGEGQPPYDLAS